ncbi:MAG TPA: carboxypeptidase regulatory-like domain-containing protein [Terriglobia bacterium]|nr:carboxypeptidase regulatory-like domain-containing protein [Terriglobia bacterium]
MSLIYILLLLQAPAQPAASIAGSVLRAGTSTPVAGARVDLRSDTGPVASVTADADGRFTFPNLAAGRYRLSAAHDGFVPGGKYGPAVAIDLESQQDLKGIRISLTALSAISGRVLDRSNNPVPNAKVQALRYTYQDGRRILIPARTETTNSAGEYRLFSMNPTQYIVSVSIPESSGNDSTESYLPIYFPGVTDAAAASPIDIPSGAEFNGVDFTLTKTVAPRVRGIVVDGRTGDALVNASVLIVPRRGTLATGSSQRTTTGAGGAFEVQHLAAGAYNVVATATIDGRLAAVMPIDIGAGDIDNLVIVVLPQMNINGHLALENSTGPLPFRPDAVRIDLRPEPFSSELLIPVPNIDGNGVFTFNGVTPGDYEVRVRLNGIRGYVKSVRFGAGNAGNGPFRISTNAPLEVLLSLNAASLDGSVVDNDQKPYDDATVVLVPDPPQRQRLDLYYVTGTDRSGQFHLTGIAPGDYHLFAWDDVPSDAWQDPDFLRLYESRGKPVHADEGSQENFQLTVIPRA